MRKKIPGYAFEYLKNLPRKRSIPDAFSENISQKVLRFHSQLPDYQPTSLIRLHRLARSWEVKNVLIKDESKRFGLRAFKVLGSSYAVAQLLCRKLELDIEDIDFEFLLSDEVRQRIGRITLASATDGNHGRGIAWTAEQLQQQSVVYMPKGTVPSRVDCIRSHGAAVEVTDLNYDDTVRLCFSNARKNGWHVVQDTSMEGYTDIPLWIMQGYITMCAEAVTQMFQLGIKPTHVFLQAGVGSMAGAVAGYLANKFQENSPKFIIMEPRSAACFLISAAAGDGEPHAVKGDLDTIMAGLACDEPNRIAWEILRDFPSCYISCDDVVAANGCRILDNPLKGDNAVEAGESGSVGIGLLDLLINNPDFEKLKQDLEIGPDASLLFFNTEGATDPENYRQILWYGKYGDNRKKSKRV